MPTEHISAARATIETVAERTALVLIVEPEGGEPLRYLLRDAGPLITGIQNAERAIRVKASQRKPHGHRSG